MGIPYIPWGCRHGVSRDTLLGNQYCPSDLGKVMKVMRLFLVISMFGMLSKMSLACYEFTLSQRHISILKAKEKLSRKQSQQGRGKSPDPNKCKEFTHGIAHKYKDETKKPQSHLERGGSSWERQGGGRNYSSGRGRRGGGDVRCNACGKTRHMSWKCPKKNK